MNTFIKNNNLLISNNSTATSNSQYFILNENEWVKANHYDPTIAGYYFYATRTNTAPTRVTANSIGDGSAGSVGNFANFNNGAIWNGATGNVTTVGTNGGPSYYGIFDGGGNVNEWTDGLVSTDTRRVRGGNYATTGAPNIGFAVLRTITNRGADVGFRVGSYTNTLNLPNFVNIGDINNPSYDKGYGSVGYNYSVCSFQLTNNEYVDFLNSVAGSPYADTYQLYSTLMTSNVRGGIFRYGSAGSYNYSVKTNMGNKPVNYVSYLSAIRYCNWLTNGKPVGPQNLTTTEDGTYYINGATFDYFPRKT